MNIDVKNKIGYYLQPIIIEDNSRIVKQSLHFPYPNTEITTITIRSSLTIKCKNHSISLTKFFLEHYQELSSIANICIDDIKQFLINVDSNTDGLVDLFCYEAYSISLNYSSDKQILILSNNSDNSTIVIATFESEIKLIILDWLRRLASGKTIFTDVYVDTREQERNDYYIKLNYQM